MKKAVKKKTGICLDIGCGGNKQNPNWIGMDARKLKGVDIVHNLERIPWPLKSESVIQVLASHIIEHIKPWKFIPVMDEIWRICKPNSQLAISMPHGQSKGMLQDPTHCNFANEVTWQYFDPGFPLYGIYQPKPWKVESNIWVPHGNMEIILAKRVR